MRSLILALALVSVGALTAPVSAQAPTRVTETGGVQLSYPADSLCSFPVTYRIGYTQAFQVFWSDGVRTRTLEHVRAEGWYRNDVTGTTITFSTSMTLAQDLTEQNFIYLGVIVRYRSEDGGVLAVRRGRLRLNRYGEVTFDAAGASKVIDVCPFLA